MKLQYHVLYGGLVASALVPTLGANSAIFWASSVLIDGDHYLDYVYRNGFRDYSVKRMFVFHERLYERAKEPEFLGLNLMHTAEFVILAGVAAVITGWTWLIAALSGVLLHMLLDLFYLYRRGRLFRRALSIIEYVIRVKRMRRRGLRPELPYQLALQSLFERPKWLKTK